MARHSNRAAGVPCPVPARAGVGLKPEHYWDILETTPDVGWFEVHPENYMGDGGYPHHVLGRIRERYPLSLHGVGLSIGGAAPLDRHHLLRLRALAERYEPGLVSEHLAWSTHEGYFLNDLLPLPYTEQTLAHVARHVDQVQATLKRTILIENPSTYVAFAESELTEIEFLAELSRRTGCGLLLDCNNAYVSAVNRREDPRLYINSFPVERVGEIHLAGHAETTDEDGGPLLIDAHDRSVIDAVWSLYERVVDRAGAVPTLIEWDNDIPAWSELFGEAQTAERILAARKVINACAA